MGGYFVGGNGVGGSGGGGKPPLAGALGSTCTSDNECSGSICSDGVCCDQRCDSPCGNCAVAGDEGTCISEPVGELADPNASCNTCDGLGSCADGNYVTDSLSFLTGDPMRQSTFSTIDVTLAELIADVAVDDQGGYAITGTITGDPELEDHGTDVTTFTPGDGSSQDAFVARYNALGELQWAKRLAPVNDGRTQLGKQIAFDPNGDLVVATQWSGDIQADGVTFQASNINQIALLKLDEATGTVAALLKTAVGFTSLDHLVIDDQGNIVLAGAFTALAGPDFGGGALVAKPYVTNRNNPYVAKLAADGTHLWSFSAGGTVNSTSLDGLAVRPNGDVVLGGTFFGDLELYGADSSAPPEFFLQAGDMSANGFAAVFAAADGLPVWADSYETLGDEVRIHGMATDDDDNLALTGRCNQNATFGSTSITGAGSYTIFVAKLSWNDTTPGYETQWVSAEKDANVTQQNHEGRSLAFDRNGNVVLTGNFRRTLVWDNKGVGQVQLYSDGTFSYPSTYGSTFVAKLHADDGKALWAHSLGGGIHHHNFVSHRIRPTVAVAPDGTTVLISPFNDTPLSSATTFGPFDYTKQGTASTKGLPRDSFVARFGP